MSRILLYLTFFCAIAIAAMATLTRYCFDEKKALKENVQLHAKYDSYKRSTSPFGLIASSHMETLTGEIAREESDHFLGAYWKEIAAHVINCPLQEDALDWIEHNPAHLNYFEIDLPPPFRG